MERHSAILACLSDDPKHGDGHRQAELRRVLSLRRFLYDGSDWFIHRPIIRSAAGAVSGNWQSTAAPEASENSTEAPGFDPELPSSNCAHCDAASRAVIVGP